MHAWRVQHQEPRTSSRQIIPKKPNDPREEYIALLREQEEQFQSGKAIAQAIENDDAELSTPALLTNWMRRTGWLHTFRNSDRAALMSLSTLPIVGRGPLRVRMNDGTWIESLEFDERRLAMVVRALDRLFDRCADTVQHTDVSTRRWLRGRFVDRPYKVSFELVGTEASEQKYRKLMKRCICLWVRLWQLPPIITREVCGQLLCAGQRRAIQSLWFANCWNHHQPSGTDIIQLDSDGDISDYASESGERVDSAAYEVAGDSSNT